MLRPIRGFNHIPVTHAAEAYTLSFQDRRVRRSSEHA